MCPMDKKSHKYSSIEDIGRNWDIQDCMALHQTKQQAKETHEAQFGQCTTHQRKAKFICDCDSVSILCSECIISHINTGHTLISLVEIKKSIIHVVDQKVRTCENYIRHIKSTINDRKNDLKEDYKKVRKNIESQRDNLIA
jgi:hypothetical protein